MSRSVTAGDPAVIPQERATWLKVRLTIEDEIASRHAPGDVLPSEERLARRFGVNRHTVRRALQGLTDAGLIERRRGLGSLVIRRPGTNDAGGRIEYRVSERTRFSQIAGMRGRRTGVKVLGRSLRAADPETRQRLGLTDEAPVLVIETLRSVDRAPFCLTTHHFPADPLAGVADRYRGGPLHDWLQKTYGWNLYRASSAASVAMPEEADAATLAIPRTQPVLIVKSVNLLARDGMPIEFAITRFRGDRVELHMTF